MSQESVAVPIKILGVKYQISCEPGEEKALLESATLLDERLAKMREQSRLSIEQASMMVALNLAHDLLKAKREVEESEDKIQRKLESLLAKIDEQMGA